MKKLLFAALAAFGLWACSSQEEPQLPVQDEGMPETEFASVIRTPEEAKACAINAFSRFYGMSRAIMPIKDVRCVKSKTGSRSAISDTLYYIVNTENNDGYAIIAANREVEPVLAVTESGNIEDPGNVENPGLAMYLDDMADCLSHTLDYEFKRDDSLTTIRPMYPIDPFTETRTTTSTSETISEPRAPYKWGQDFPEGYYFPNKIAGCSNIASVLAMSYFEEPKQYPINRKMETIDWATIKSHKISGYVFSEDNCGSGIDAPAHKALAHLCWGISEQNRCSYKETETSTSISNVRKMFVNSIPTLSVSDIIEGRPKAQDYSKNSIILMRAAFTDITGKDRGHEFIIDGYLTKSSTTTVAQRKLGEKFWTVISQSTTYSYYNHINWGWNGLDNGYFYYSEYDTGAAERYDNPYQFNNSGYAFTKDYRFFVIHGQ